jgi:type III pantothenate kinase
LNLYVDIGNSRIKLLQDHDTAVAYYLASRPLAEIVADYSHARPAPRRIIVANVAGEQVANEFNNACDQVWGKFPDYISVASEFDGVTNGYSDYKQLGVDRWLAIIAAWYKYKTHLCVIDCGSAVTLDVVTASGQHDGGYIIPGPYLMQQALARNTSQLPLPGASTATFAAGRTTAECIQNGTALAVVSFIENRVRSITAKTGVAYECILTGGGAGEIIEFIDLEIRHEPLLVLEGIKQVSGS